MTINPMRPTPERRRLIVIGAAVAAVLLALLIWAVAGGESDAEVALREAAEALQPNLPIPVDEVTTWTGVAAEGETMIMTYTLAGAAGDYDGDAIEETMRPAVVQQACAQATAGGAAALDMGATFTYRYVAADGEDVGEFSMTGDDCPD